MYVSDQLTTPMIWIILNKKENEWTEETDVIILPKPTQWFWAINKFRSQLFPASSIEGQTKKYLLVPSDYHYSM